jgi:signal transduction histidine kinase
MLDSLRSRLALSNLLITLLGLLVVVLVFTNILVNRTTDVKKADRQQDARDIAGQVERLYRLHARPSVLNQFVYSASRILGARIIIVGADGKTLLVDSATKTPFYTGTWKPLDRRALQQGREAQVLIRKSTNLYSFQVPIHGVHRAKGGAVMLIVRVTDVHPSIQSLAFFLLLALGTALLVWLLIGVYFTYSLSQPLLQIMQATRQMAAGDYGVRVHGRGQGEIARLAASFNTMAERVQQANQVLKDFVANVSHDLRTPLTMITGYSQALLDGTAGPDESEGAAAVIHDEALKMQRLVEDLLQLTRLESGLMSLHRQPVTLRPFVEQLVDRVQQVKGTAGVDIRNEVLETVPPVDIDPVQMERALRNLVDNALQHTPPGGTVTIRAEQVRRGWVEIAVSDTGQGIAPQDLPRVFERFYRSDRSRGRERGNAGLGLAIVREIVEAHGGSIAVESEPGKGASFRFTVATAPEGASPEPDREEATTW